MKDNYAFRSSTFMRALLVLLFMAVSIQWGFAQLNLNVSRGTLGTVIEQIKSQSKYQFFYDDKLAALSVENVKVNNVSIEDALNVILKGKNISYKVEDNIVYLSEKTATSQEGKQQGKERTITGVVSDDMGPLIGVNVLVKGTSNGCITDLDGNFTLTTTEANPVLVFSYIGYKSQEISATGSASINVLMQNDTQMIEEVVVTALGIKRSEKALSYNVQQVNTDAITSNKDANFVNSLSGKVAGVNINASSSGVGGVSKVVMRGTKSIMQSSNALYVIDGVPIFSGRGTAGGKEFDSQGSSEPIADINPEISDDEARTITVQDILIKTYSLNENGERVPYNTQAKQEAYQRAQEACSRARAGEDFSSLIAEYNEDENSTYSFGKGTYDDTFEEAAFNLGTGMRQTVTR